MPDHIISNFKDHLIERKRQQLDDELNQEYPDYDLIEFKEEELADLNHSSLDKIKSDYQFSPLFLDFLGIPFDKEIDEL